MKNRTQQEFRTGYVPAKPGHGYGSANAVEESANAIATVVEGLANLAWLQQSMAMPSRRGHSRRRQPKRTSGLATGISPARPTAGRTDTRSRSVTPVRPAMTDALFTKTQPLKAPRSNRRHSYLAAMSTSARSRDRHGQGKIVDGVG